MVFGSTVLEVAIGMIFVYLLMSLLCSAFNELINAFFKLRAKDLEDGIRRLLDDEQQKRGWLDKLSRFFRRRTSSGAGDLEKTEKLSDRFFNHALIKPFSEDRRPSYIPARTFSLALWNMATAAAAQARKAAADRAAADKENAGKVGGAAPPPQNAGDTGTQQPAGDAEVFGVDKNLTLLRDTIATLPDDELPKNLKQSLVTLIDEADHNFDKARANVENWYNDAMDRVSGAFRRRTQYILIGLGFAVAASMNVDSFNIVQVLWNSDDLRKAVADAAEVYAKTPPPTPTPKAASTGAGPTNTPTPTPAKSPTPAPLRSPTPRQAGAQGTPAAPTPAPTPAPTSTPAPTPSPAASPTPAPAGTEASDAKADFEAARKKIKDIQKELNGFGLPIGWACGWRDVPVASSNNSNSNANSNSSGSTNANGGTNANASVSPTPAPKTERKWKCENIDDNPRGAPHGLLPWLLKLAGIFLTAMAVSQGAPFWFDLLNKLIVIRSTVKPREKSREEGTKDKRPTPPPTPPVEGEGNG